MDRTSLTLELTGDLVPEMFCDFINHRSAVLDVGAVVVETAPDRIVVAVHGQHDLVGAFEMACELAPGSSIVHGIRHLD